MSSSRARIEVSAGPMADAIADSLSGEEGSAIHVLRENGTVIVDIGPEALAHVRAAVNSVLRLVQAGHGALEASGAPRG